MSSSAQARVLIVNRALSKLGLPASYTIDGETQLGGTVDRVWEGTAARAFATFDWSFTKKLFKPTQLAGSPENGWSYGFALPAERIGEPLHVLDQAGTAERFLREFMLEAGNIYTNVTPIWVRCRVAVDPSYWDAGFTEAFAMALAGDLAVPLIQDESAAQTYEQMAYGSPQQQGGGGLFGKIFSLNKGAEPTGRNFMANDPLTAARQTGTPFDRGSPW